MLVRVQKEFRLNLSRGKATSPDNSGLYSATDLYNIPGLQVLLKKNLKNCGVIRGPFANDDDR